MNIDSRATDITRDMRLGDSGSAERRQRSDTSNPSGISTREPIFQKGDNAVNVESTAQVASIPDNIDVQKAVDELNSIVRSQQKDVSFSVDKKSNTAVIRVYKTQTGELIKQFPPDEILAMIARIRSNIGWLVDKTA